MSKEHSGLADKMDTPQEEHKRPTFKQELTDLINKHSLENTSNTPDFIIAHHLDGDTMHCHVSNLAWATHAENVQDGFDRGRLAWNKDIKSTQNMNLEDGEYVMGVDGLKTYESVYEPGVVMKNIIIWFDDTIRPWPNHHNCSGKWFYDGQVYYHKEAHYASR